MTRHAPGFGDYARATGAWPHRAQVGWWEGREPFCDVCGYRIAGARKKAEKKSAQLLDNLHAMV